MLYLINIHWQRRHQTEGTPQTGYSTYAESGRNYSTAKGKAVRKFNRQFAAHFQINKVVEYKDPAGIFTS